MAAFIAATGNGDIPTGSTDYKTVFAAGMTLFLMTLVMNMIASASSASTARSTNERPAQPPERLRRGGDRASREGPRKERHQGQGVQAGDARLPRGRAGSPWSP